MARGNNGNNNIDNMEMMVNQHLDQEENPIQIDQQAVMPEQQFDSREELERQNQQQNRQQNRQENQQGYRHNFEKNWLQEKLSESKSVITHIPKKSALHGEFGSKFKVRVSEKKRMQAQNNKKSRLYQKKLNADLVNTAMESMQKQSFDYLGEAIKKSSTMNIRIDLLDNRELADVSAFMGKDKNENKNVLRCFFGEEEGFQKDRIKALDKMSEIILRTDLSNIRLENDKEIAQNAATLERLSAQIAAFDQLARKEDYFGTFERDGNAEFAKDLQERLEKYRSIVNYYLLRKDIITDPMYMKHYNDELSLDVTAAKTPEEKEMAEKLLSAYVASKYMMEKNGISAKTIAGKGTPEFKNAASGKKLLAGYEKLLKAEGAKFLIKDRYNKTRPISKAEDIIVKEPAIMDSVYEKAVENVKNYPGFYFLKPGYQEEPYDPVKVKSYIKEIRSIRIDSLKCSTYREMIEKFQENFAIIDRALFLQNQIARGLMHGYTDPSLDDDTMVELRARAAFFTSVKRALLQTNHKIYENKRAAGATTAQWDREMKNQIPNRFDYVIHTFEGGHAQEVFEKYLADYKEENDTKEHTIKVLHRLLLSNNPNQEISAQELNERKSKYNRNAFIQDFMNQDIIIEPISPTTSIVTRLEEENRRQNKPTLKAPREFGSFVGGMSGEEIERLYKLATGTPEEQMQYYTYHIMTLYNYDLKNYNASDLGNLANNWHEKRRIAHTTADNVHLLVRYMEELINQSGGKLKVPEPFTSIEEMKIKLKDHYDFACTITSNRTSGLSTLCSEKYAHVLTPEEMGRCPKERIDQLEGRNEQLGTMAENRQLTEEEMDAHDAIEMIIPMIRVLNSAKFNNPNEYYSFEDDVPQAYQEYVEFMNRRRQAQNQQNS